MVLPLQPIHFASIAILFQGLAALCEKEDNPQLNAELPEVYTKLLQIYERYSVRTYCAWNYWALLFYFHTFYVKEDEVAIQLV